MTSTNVVTSFLGKPFGVFRLSAGISVLFTLVYWLNRKRRSNKDDNDNAIENNNEVPKLDSSGWIECGRVKELYYYPLKSGKGKPIIQCAFTDYGISFEEDGLLTLKDRMFLVYDGKTGKFQTAKNHAKLVLVRISAVGINSVKLEADGMPSLVFNIPEKVGPVECSMWFGETVKCIDCGSGPAAWISKYITGRDDADFRLGSSVSKRRNILKGPWEKFIKVYTTLRNEDTGYFADLASYMLMNENSVGELNSRLERPVSFLQFRPNILVSGCEPFAEDNWEWIKVGESVILRNVKPCPRCVVTRVDPETAKIDPLEPLKTLRSFREQKDPKRVAVDGKAPLLGIYCGLYEKGPVRIGDKVFVRLFSTS